MNSCDSKSSGRRVTNDPQIIQLASDMAGKFVGPMPIKEFLARFVPMPEGTEKMPKTCFDKVLLAKDELNMYDPFFEECNKLHPLLEFINTSLHPDRFTRRDVVSDARGLKVGGIVYDKRRPRSEAKTDFDGADIPVELKPKIHYDAFTDAGENSAYPFEHSTDRGIETRGQLIAYASAILQVQFRRFCFTVLVCYDLARIIRWDRAGAIVTNAFPYIEDNNLAQFFWRYGHMSPAARGYDATVLELQNLVPESRKRICEALHVAETSRLYEITTPPCPTVFLKKADDQAALAQSADKDEAPILDRLVQAVSSLSQDIYIVAAPPYLARCPVGKSTRSMFAVKNNIKDEPSGTAELFHLKDTWRVAHSDFEQESVIYQHLQTQGVPHIGTLLWAGDTTENALEGATETQYYCNKYPSSSPYSTSVVPLPLRHHRILSKPIPFRFWEFRSTRLLVEAFHDAVEAHAFAEKADYRHRDISVKNIMIGADGSGVLIDWDCAKRISVMSKQRRQNRTGTWQFTSSHLLQNPGALHELMDELESFFWVLLWVSLRYCSHNLSPTKLLNKLESIFDGSKTEDDQILGGDGKKAFLNENFEQAVKFRSRPLMLLLHNLHQIFEQRYNPPKMRPANNMATPAILARDLKIFQAVTAVHEEDMDKLRSHAWILQLLKDSLSSPDWPTNDAAKANVLPTSSSSARKRPELSTTALSVVSVTGDAANAGDNVNVGASENVAGDRKRRRTNAGLASVDESRTNSGRGNGRAARLPPLTFDLSGHSEINSAEIVAAGRRMQELIALDLQAVVASDEEDMDEVSESTVTD